MGRPENVRYENQFYRPRRVNNNGLYILFLVTVALVVTTIVLAVVTLKKGKKAVKETTESTSKQAIVTNDQGETVDPTGIIVVTPTVTPAPMIEEYQNPILYPATAKMDVLMGKPKDENTPSGRKVSQTVYNGDEKVSGYQRQDEIHMGDPLNYQKVGGILTFRGNNFRNCASWGTFSLDPAKDKHLEEIWSVKSGDIKGRAFPYWCGTLWTGQPLAVKWDWNVQQLMNLYPEKKSKKDLTEVIVAAGDGYVYFLDLEDGQPTRDKLKLGFTVKGTPAIDPRGYPILYVGQGDNNVEGAPDKVGFRIINLMNFEIIHYQCGLDSRAFRSSWGACDSSPIVCADADTLIYPNENGMVYTVKLNTQFNVGTGTLSINPQTIAYKFIFDEIQQKALYGIESSMAVYDHYGWFTDSAGDLICLDLNTLEMIWSRRLGDDSDVTPVIEESNGHVYLYTGTEVDWQKDHGTGTWQGASFTYKVDAMTGEIVWETSRDCFSYSDVDNRSNDVNGGMLGTPVIGKGKASNLVFFSYCMTKGYQRGNSIIAYDKETGNRAWEYVMEYVEDPEHINDPYSWSSPVDVYDDQGNPYIMICDSYGQVHMVDALTGDFVSSVRLQNKAFPNEKLNNTESSPIVVDGILVVGTRGMGIYGVKIS
ncbi:MAG: PQQ-binding-like beta-propeller repeat protein [Clostridiales bacterium]|nr:PQQ-binding-like beta-propeller repeat protein [Clostridiales bacterium]